MEVDVVRKPIRNLNLRVYSPDGRVRVAVPLSNSDEAVQKAVVGFLQQEGDPGIGVLAVQRFECRRLPAFLKEA